ncbi:Putative diacylglycerol O-acyltransferase Rv1760 [Arthrobacter sp. Bi83]|nr:Putative diacylglycerol O-acyltransferase Rv1760 [Arthrobacter sp. Bi83]
MPHTPLGAMFGNRLISGIMIKFVARRRVNVLSADLPGPRDPLYFCGARILEVFPLLNLIGNVSLGVGAISCAGSSCMLVVSDADAYPDLDVFTDKCMPRPRGAPPGHPETTGQAQYARGGVTETRLSARCRIPWSILRSIMNQHTSISGARIQRAALV